MGDNSHIKILTWIQFLKSPYLDFKIVYTILSEKLSHNLGNSNTKVNMSSIKKYFFQIYTNFILFAPKSHQNPPNSIQRVVLALYV